ncbi:hypothetical protein ADUPG1_002224, partial [Aduncisulcus paluster]
KFLYTGSLGFITQQQCQRIDSLIKEKLCKSLRCSPQSFPLSYIHSSRSDGGIGILSLQQSIDVSRASTFLTATSDTLLKDSFINDFLPQKQHEWVDGILELVYTQGDIARVDDSAPNMRILNLNWLSALLSIRRLGLKVKMEDGRMKLFKEGSSLVIDRQTTHLLRKFVDTTNHAEWSTLFCGRACTYFKRHPGSTHIDACPPHKHPQSQKVRRQILFVL